jgi:hypothetical protein
MTIGTTPTLADVARAAAENAVAELHVAVPARVERVDLAKGIIDAKPLVKDRRYDRDGQPQAISVAVVSNVPLVFPGAGGFRVTFPVAVGDTVLLVFSERSLDLWLVQGGEVDPLDDRRHHLSDAVAIPGLRDFGHAWKGIDTGSITIGKDGSAQHPAGLGDQIASALETLKTAINSHTHPSNGSVATTGHISASLPTVQSSTVTITE